LFCYSQFCFEFFTGASVNEYQITDLGIVEEDSRVNLFGDTVIASHPFAVVGKRYSLQLITVVL